MRDGFFSTKIGMFRAVKGFLVQFGIAGDPAVTAKWRKRGGLPDDPQWLDMREKRRVKRGMLSFAGGGPNSRQTEMFIAYQDIALGGAKHEVRFGRLLLLLIL